jgi:hypothetical protein
MKPLKKEVILASLLILFISSFCFSQPAKYRDAIRPQNKHTLDSLYPHATGIILREFHVVDTAQLIDINCNCSETKGAIELLFDTNGTLLNKEVTYHDTKNLPDTIRAYMKRNWSLAHKFDNNYMIMGIDNRADTTYSIMMYQRYPGTGNQNTDEFLLKFDRYGRFISKEKVIEGMM